MRNELTGIRDLSFSVWHRTVRRFINPFRESTLGMIDIDSCEYCKGCHKILALIETVRGGPDKPKTTKVLENLAKAAGVPAFLMRYQLANETFKSKLEDGSEHETHDIAEFYLDTVPPTKVQTMSPQQFAEWLFALHMACGCQYTINVLRIQPL